MLVHFSPLYMLGAIAMTTRLRSFLFFLLSVFFCSFVVRFAVAEIPNDPLKLSAVFQQFSDLDDAALDELMKKEGVEVPDLSLYGAGNDGDSGTSESEERLSGEAPKRFLSIVHERQDSFPLTETALDNRLLTYTGGEVQGVPSSDATSVADFFTNFAGKTRNGVALTFYIMFRQLVWLYQQRANEPGAWISSQVWSYSKAVGFVDWIVRVGFVGARLLLDLREIMPFFSRTLEQVGGEGDGGEMLVDMAQLAMFPAGMVAMLGRVKLPSSINPEIPLLPQVQRMFARAYTLFTRHVHFGSDLTFTQRMMLDLLLPFIFAGFVSSRSHHGVMQVTAFQKAVTSTLMTTTEEVVANSERVANSLVSAHQWDWLFRKSFGVLRQRTVRDLIYMVSEYILRSHVAGELKDGFGEYMQNKLILYAKKSSILFVAMSLLAYGVRHGLIQKTQWLGERCGDLLVACGIARNNPVASVRQWFANVLSGDAHGFGKRNSDLLDSPFAIVFPGELRRAVQHVVTQKDLPLLLKRNVRFMDSLGSLQEIDWTSIGSNPFAIMFATQGSEDVIRSLSPEQRKAVSTAFFNEILINLFLNRESFVCQYSIEYLLSWLGARLLPSVEL